MQEPSRPARRFSEEFVERVLDANNIVDIISQHTQLKLSSGGHMGRCPFPDHPEKTPSFSVSESKQVYYCFGCHKKGNLIRFLRDFNGYTFSQAIEYLADRANIPLPSPTVALTPEEQEKIQRRKQLIAIYERAKLLYRSVLRKQPEDSLVKKYIKKRGISPETAETFGIGYAPAEWDSLVTELNSSHLPLGLAEEGRLIRARDGKTGYYDFFRDRLMFPVHNFKGEVIAFGGRIIQEGEPKYLNSPEHFLFSKRKTLYGLFITGKYIRAEDSAILVEGYMDLISLYQAGIRNAVASMGTAFTPEQAQAIKRLTQNVILLYDGDTAGIEAAKKALPILLAAGLHPKGITLPEGMDPDDFVKSRGPDSLKELLRTAKDLFLLVLHSRLGDFRGDPAEKLSIAEEAMQTLNLIPDARLKGLYEKELIFRLGVDVRWLRSLSLQSGGPSGLGANAPANPRGPIGNARPAKPAPNESEGDLSEDAQESLIKIQDAPQYLKLLVALSLQKEELFRRLLDSPWRSDIRHEGIQSLLSRSERIYRQAPEKFDKLTGLLMSFVDYSEALLLPASLRRSRNLVASSLEAGSVSSDSDEKIFVSDDRSVVSEPDGAEDEKLWMDCVRKFRDEIFALRAKEIQLQLRSGSSPELLQELQQIHQDRRKLILDPNYVRKNIPEENI